MKRKGNLYHKIYDLDNLRLADKKASRGKSYQKGVIEHKKIQEENLLKLHFILRNKEYRTSPYLNFQIMENKIRDISRLPYFPDRICQHAIANIIEPILSSTFISDSYAAIVGKGIHKASFALRKVLKDNPNLKYCLKMDIRKFYPSVPHNRLKELIRKKIKCKDTLNLIDEIIDSGGGIGLPLGNYLSQCLANFYLSYFDHWLKEVLKVKHAFRYCDDIVIVAADKTYLHEILIKIKEYLNVNLKLEVKGNWQVFPIEVRGIDFVGYVIKIKNEKVYVKLRKRIKKRFARMLLRNKNSSSIASYLGWLKYGNCKHLEKKLLKYES